MTVHESGHPLAPDLGSSGFNVRSLVLNKDVSWTLTLRNDSEFPISNLSVQENSDQAFVSQPRSRRLAPGASTTFTLRIKPTSLGFSLLEVIISYQDGGIASIPVSFEVTESGSLASDFQEGFDQVYDLRPESNQVDPLIIDPDFDSIPGSRPFRYQWLKDGKPITGATSRLFSIARVNAKHTGVYACRVSNSYGSAVSPGYGLAVISQTLDRAVSVIESKPFTLAPENCPKSSSAYWTFESLYSDTGEFKNDGRRAGIQSAVFRNLYSIYTDAGTYTLNFAGQVIASYRVSVITAPYLWLEDVSLPVGTNAAIYLPEGSFAVVAGDGDFPPSYTYSRFNLDVRNLPPGLRVARHRFYDEENDYSYTSLAIVGRCYVPGIYTVILTATNAAGSSGPVPLTITVTPLETYHVGTFVSVLSPNDVLPLGGKVVIQITRTGAFSGSLSTHRHRYSFAGQIGESNHEGIITSTISLGYVRGFGTMRLRLTLGARNYPQGEILAIDSPQEFIFSPTISRLSGLFSGRYHLLLNDSEDNSPISSALLLVGSSGTATFVSGGFTATCLPITGGYPGPEYQLYATQYNPVPFSLIGFIGIDETQPSCSGYLQETELPRPSADDPDPSPFTEDFSVVGSKWLPVPKDSVVLNLPLAGLNASFGYHKPAFGHHLVSLLPGSCSFSVYDGSYSNYTVAVNAVSGTFTVVEKYFGPDFDSFDPVTDTYPTLRATYLYRGLLYPYQQEGIAFPADPFKRMPMRLGKPR